MNWDFLNLKKKKNCPWNVLGILDFENDLLFKNNLFKIVLSLGRDNLDDNSNTWLKLISLIRKQIKYQILIEIKFVSQY